MGDALRSAATPRGRWTRALAVVAGSAVLALPVIGGLGEAEAQQAPATPQGLGAIALDGRVNLSWKATAGATSYALYRGTSLATITTRVTPVGHTARSYTDTGRANGTTYYYKVRALASGIESPASSVVQVVPRARTCSSANAVINENCYPGTTAWKTTNGTRAHDGGIEGFASASSVNQGGSVDLRVITDWNAPYRIEIYRTGHYGGSQGRLVSVLPGMTGEWQPGCMKEPSTTGIIDCAGWPVETSFTTSTSWPSGVYLLKLVREDNGTSSEIPLVVRRDGSTSTLLYHVPTSTYQAYNRFEGKSLYDGQSDPPNTVTGAHRAVKVSFERPYSQPTETAAAHDWYTRTDLGVVSWLEQQGFDTTYIASEDFHANGAQLRQHRVFVSGSHDEYWSQQMFDQAIAARNAGTSLAFMGANAAYWRIRFEASPVSGRANRVVVVYKTIQSGPPDPSGSPTTTWRDPSGPNRPENELIGQMYVGDNSLEDFPLRVSAQEGGNRIWRYASPSRLAPGASATIGTGIVGWEWDARVANGREPAGVATVASSPVSGGLVQENGRFQTQGTTSANATIYRAASGAYVFATGTNNWWRGLAPNVHGQGEANADIRQLMANVLADMGARAPTPAAGILLDPAGAPAVTSTVPAGGATSVLLNAPLSVRFDRELDPSTVNDSDFTLTRAGGGAIAVDAVLDNATRTVELRPEAALEPTSSYTVTIGTNIQGWNGAALAAPYSWSFTSGQGTPPVVTFRSPADGQAGVATDAVIEARFDRRLDPASVSAANYQLRPAAGGAPLPAELSYDDASRTARLEPSSRLEQSTSYTAELTTGIRAYDGAAMASPTGWTFTTGSEVQVSSRTPAPFASGVSPAAVVRAVFSRDVDPATVNGTGFRLDGPGGLEVAASVSYDAPSRTATLTPAQPLALSSAYTVGMSATIRGTDGAPLAPISWSFSTAPSAPPGPAVTATTPAAGATGVPNDAPVTATFDRPLDPATLTSQSFTLARPGAAPVAAVLDYDAAANRALLTPAAPLAVGVEYSARLSTAVRAASGAPLAADVSWSFTTADCPCSLMNGLSPAQTGLPVHDGRPGAGPFSYELGTKITVDEPTELAALRFYKSSGEDAGHVGRVWSSTGTELAQVTYVNETASGWQRQGLTTPLTLSPGQVYTLSVGLNSFYSKTVGGLGSPLSSGPLRSVAGANGVFAEAAGQFPTQSWQSSNYFVDGVVRSPGSPPRTPAVTTVSPVGGAGGVPVESDVTAAFSVPLDPSTVGAANFTLTPAGGSAVAVSISYDDATRTAALDPLAALQRATVYTARLETGIRSDDGTALPAAYTWTFSTDSHEPPVVTARSPVDGAQEVSPLTTVSATFSRPLDPATVDSTSFRLEAPGGSSVPATLAYDAATRTASLTPAGALAPSTTYVVRLGTGLRSDQGVALAAPESWTFTTSSCSCRLFAADSPAVTATNLETRNGRAGPGPWTLELGIKISVSQPARLEAIRYLRDAGETGSHAGRVWSSSGVLLGSVSFGAETGSGWQQATLATPLALAPGQTYVVSVGFNERFGMSADGLETPVVSGPLRSVGDGQNGVFADAAGAFPTQSWRSSNYWVDAVVR